MKNFKLTIEYDGTNYFGWQRQDGSKRPTVQGVIESAIKRVFGCEVNLIGSGRTDSGVHALGQVANFKVSTCLEPNQIQRAVNAYLPRDILVKKAEEAPIDFHARFNAKSKCYRYTILNTKRHSVFNRFYAMHYPYHLDLRLMRRAAKKLDYKVVIRKDGDFVYIDVVGKGFGYRMVRRIVGLLIGVASGKIAEGCVKKSVFSNARTAPGCGLVLVGVEY